MRYLSKKQINYGDACTPTTKLTCQYQSLHHHPIMFSSIEMCHFVALYSSFCFNCINQDLVKYFCNNRKKRISRSIYLYISMSQNYYMNDGYLIHNLIDAILIGLEIFALKNKRLKCCKQICLRYFGDLNILASNRIFHRMIFVFFQSNLCKNVLYLSLFYSNLNQKSG